MYINPIHFVYSLVVGFYWTLSTFPPESGWIRVAVCNALYGIMVLPLWKGQFWSAVVKDLYGIWHQRGFLLVDYPWLMWGVVFVACIYLLFSFEFTFRGGFKAKFSSEYKGLQPGMAAQPIGPNKQINQKRSTAALINFKAKLVSRIKKQS